MALRQIPHTSSNPDRLCGRNVGLGDVPIEVSSAAQQQPALPESVWRILASEFGERFCYYGLRAILTLYFVSIGYSEAGAVSLFAYTSALAYFMPLLGGMVADFFLGRYRTILIFSLVYILGTSLLAVSAAYGGGATGASVALLLISVGTGGIKPCVSAFGADQLQQSDDITRARYFANFYLAINAGSIFSFAVIPTLRTKFGFPVAFAASAVVLSLALVVFVSGRESYRQSPPDSSFYVNIITEVKHRLSLAFGGMKYRQIITSRVAPTTIGSACTDETNRPERELDELPRSSAQSALVALRRLLPVMSLMPCFWALFDQQGSVWVLQAKSMRLDGVLPFGWQLTPEMLQITNPICVLVLVPLTTRFLEKWPRMFGGKTSPPPLMRMVFGMLMAALAFVYSAALQWWVDSAPVASVPVLWQLPQFVLITLAEVLVSVVSLDYFYAQAPAEAKTAVSALALLTVSIGDVLCGLLYQVLAPHFQAREMMLAFACLMCVNAGVLLAVARSRSRS